MPHTKVLEIINKAKRLPHGKGGTPLWLKLIEARQGEILEEFGDMGQMKLANVLHYGSFGDISHKIRDHLTPNHVIVRMGSGLNLDTRGVFMFDRNTYKVSEDKTRTRMLVYGFNRKGDDGWNVAEIRLGLDGNMVVDKDVFIHSTTPYDLCSQTAYEITFPQIFAHMASTIRQFAERRKELAAASTEWWHATEAANIVLGIS